MTAPEDTQALVPGDSGCDLTRHGGLCRWDQTRDPEGAQDPGSRGCRQSRVPCETEAEGEREAEGPAVTRCRTRGGKGRAAALR